MWISNLQTDSNYIHPNFLHQERLKQHNAEEGYYVPYEFDSPLDKEYGHSTWHLVEARPAGADVGDHEVYR